MVVAEQTRARDTKTRGLTELPRNGETLGAVHVRVEATNDAACDDLAEPEQILGGVVALHEDRVAPFGTRGETPGETPLEVLLVLLRSSPVEMLLDPGRAVPEGEVQVDLPVGELDGGDGACI